MQNPIPAVTAMTLCMMWAGAAFAQADAGVENRASPAGLRCSALAELDEAERTTAVYYLAGYSNGERDAMSFGTVGQSAVESPAAGAAEAAAEQPQAEQPQEQQQAEGATATPAAPETQGGGGPPIAVLPTIPVEAILAACAQSPDSRIVDIITAQGAMSG